MLPFGSISMSLGALLMAFGLFGNTTVTGSGGAFGMDRIHNLGLLGRQAAMVTSRIGLLIAGSVFAVGGLISAQLASMSFTRGAAASIPACVPPSASVPQAAPQHAHGGQPAPAQSSASVVPNTQDGWRYVTAMAEQQGWRATSGLSGVSFRRPDGHTFKPATPQEAAKALSRAMAPSVS